MSDQRQSLVVGRAEDLWRPANRRQFLRLLGIGGSVVLLPTVFAACDDNDATAPSGPYVLDLRTNTGILNYAYALEQLEAAFYTGVVASAAFGGMTAEQQEVFADLRNHEVVHREFLRAALGGSAIETLALNSTTVGAALSSTANILRAAEAFEDLGVAAYNGAGKYVTDAALLTVAGKIVSVEARHAAAIRDMRDAAGVTAGASAGTRFAGDDVVDPGTGLDVKLEPSAVLARVSAANVVTSPLSIGRTPASKPGTSDAGPPSPTP